MTFETVAEAYLAALARRGIDYLFANAGTDFAPLIEALTRAQSSGLAAPRAVAVPHEVVAVGMAHGFWLATGRPQAVMVHVNVGIANALVGVMNASRAHAPLLFTSGRTPFTESGHRGSRDLPIHWGQEMRDQAALVREHVKWEHELRFGDQVELVVDRALSIATAAPAGPVYLSLPRETLAAVWDGGAGATATERAQPVPSPAHPDPAAIECAAEILAGARRPLVVSAAFTMDSADALAWFADAFALPVVEHWSPCLALPTEHPMHAGFDPGELLADADAVLVLDAPVPWIPARHRIPPGCVVIQVGPDPTFLDLPLRGHPATVAICSAVRPAIEALSGALGRKLGVSGTGPAPGAQVTSAPRAASGPSAATPTDAASAASAANGPTGGGARADASREHPTIEARRRVVGNRIAGARDRNRARSGPLDRAPQPPATKAWLSRHLDVALAEDLASGRAWIWNELGCDATVMRFPRAGTLFNLSIAGALGWALPAALGAQLAAPDRIAVATIGDGSYTFANPVACHHTAARLGLPVLVVVFDNQGWLAVRHSTLAIYPEGHAARAQEMPLTSLAPSPDYAKVIEASGGYGERVDEPSAFPAALRRALDVVRRERRQALVQVRLPLG